MLFEHNSSRRLTMFGMKKKEHKMANVEIPKETTRKTTEACGGKKGNGRCCGEKNSSTKNCK